MHRKLGGGIDLLGVSHLEDLVIEGLYDDDQAGFVN